MRRGWLVGSVLAVVGCGRFGFDPTGDSGGATDTSTIPPDGFGPAATGCGPTMPSGPVVYVATTGSDTTGDGSIGAPYRTIQMTYDRVAPGTTILVQPGVYQPLDLSRTLSPQRITIAAVIPYTVTIQGQSLVIQCIGCTGLVVEGIYVHALSAGSNPVFHINSGSDVVIRNCIVDNNGTSATIRLSGDPQNVTISRVMLMDGNPALHAAQITGVTIEDSLFVDTRMVGAQLVWLEAPLGGTSVIRRNILAGFRGCTDCGSLELRLDTATHVESNLFVSGPVISDGALKLEGPTDATVQFNTIVGDVPGTAYALTGTQYAGTPISNLMIANNVFADPTGTLGDFADGTTTDITSTTLRSNAYWNAGQTIANDTLDAVHLSLDPQAVLADPQLPAYVPFATLSWDAQNLRFTDGSTSICDAFYRIATQYGLPSGGSPLIDAATGSERPADLLGFARDTTPTIGALETKQ